jgi:hypothetical protein
MPNIRQTYRHRQLRNSFTPEQLLIIDEELARIREARRIAFEQGSDPQYASTLELVINSPLVQKQWMTKRSK